ncbi:MAG: hypothetical protein K9W44_06575 [Candidatus Lokiarchaeota archaeon]|nr:hypothetical protein [Candidatus Harpocratesius repetitus]
MTTKQDYKNEISYKELEFIEEFLKISRFKIVCFKDFASIRPQANQILHLNGSVQVLVIIYRASRHYYYSSYKEKYYFAKILKQ